MEIPRGTNSAKCIYLYNRRAWNNIEATYAIPSKDIKIKKKQPVKNVSKVEAGGKKKAMKEEIQREKIKNTRYSFTSFIIPLLITGNKKDYQLLYCICALKNAVKIMSTTLRKEGFAQL